jgi:hypothetical protein
VSCAAAVVAIASNKAAASGVFVLWSCFFMRYFP